MAASFRHLPRIYNTIKLIQVEFFLPEDVGVDELRVELFFVYMYGLFG